jgi:GH15 family glucan-1,4-alpha-glucosidase
MADYGFVSDCEVCALVAPSGSVEWMCLPRMDGPSIFAAILDRHAGWFRLGPADVTAWRGDATLSCSTGATGARLLEQARR